VFVHALIDRKLKPRFPIREAILRGFIKLEQRFSGGGELVSEFHLPRNPIGWPVTNRNRVLGKTAC
jgi:hypothetical protein